MNRRRRKAILLGVAALGLAAFVIDRTALSGGPSDANAAPLEDPPSNPNEDPSLPAITGQGDAARDPAADASARAADQAAAQLRDAIAGMGEQLGVSHLADLPEIFESPDARQANADLENDPDLNPDLATDEADQNDGQTSVDFDVPDFSLSAIIHRRHTAAAIIDGRVVRTGQTHRGYTLSAVEPRTIRLAADDHIVHLTLATVTGGARVVVESTNTTPPHFCNVQSAPIPADD